MSAATDLPTLDLREQLVRIDRAIAETRKFQAETDKIHRDRFLAPFVVIAAAFTGLGATVGPVLVRALLGGHG